jgi:predicted SAM-dependent methyltransferase
MDKNRATFVYSDYLQMLASGSSETGKYRQEILKALEGLTGEPLAQLNGIELGVGGDSLIRESITIDLPFPYTKCGYTPINIKGDCRSLPWFRDGAFDYLYSSHLFEDFDPTENEKILKEWLRVVRRGGYLVLLLPEQQRYVEYCRKRKELPNIHHKVDDFGVDYMISFTERNPLIKVVYVQKLWQLCDHEEDYNFLIVLQKTDE